MNGRLRSQIIREIRTAAMEAPALYFAPLRKVRELLRTARSIRWKRSG